MTKRKCKPRKETLEGSPPNGCLKVVTNYQNRTGMRSEYTHHV